LEELELLAKTAGLEVVGSDKQKLVSPNPATYIGKGKVQEIKAISESLHADVILFDDELSPRNFRELENAFGPHVRVIDRTTLILDILRCMHNRMKVNCRLSWLNMNIYCRA
jgi:GTP-binding protein HflX